MPIHNRRTKRLSRTLTKKRHGRRSKTLILKALGRVGFRPIGVQVQHGGSLWYEAWRIVLLYDWGPGWRLKVHFQSAWLAFSHSNYLEIGGRKRHLALSVRSWSCRKCFDSLQNPPIRRKIQKSWSQLRFRRLTSLDFVEGTAVPRPRSVPAPSLPRWVPRRNLRWQPKLHPAYETTFIAKKDKTIELRAIDQSLLQRTSWGLRRPHARKILVPWCWAQLLV